MKRKLFPFLGIILLIGGLSVLFLASTPVQASQFAQQATGAIATVTGTPRGAYIVVNSDQDSGINVRSGPVSTTTKIGILLPGQQAKALGRVGDYIWIEYPGVPGGKGWVYAPAVTILGGEVLVVEPPPTSTALYTPTINPTLAAQFVITLGPTRLPTFTPPPPLAIPTFSINGDVRTGLGPIPMGMIIAVLGALGIFLGLLSLLRGK